MDRKKGALVAAILGSAVVAVDATVVNVALPTIADELGGGLAGQQWVANAYLLTLASLILVSGSLADIYGERRMFTLGVAGFGAASLLCALAPSVELLVVARALQGVSGALLTPASLAIIVAVFPESERGAAIGSWTAWGGIGYLAGPLIGGQIVDSVSWRWVFAINVPLVLLTLVMARRYVPQARDLGEQRPRLDVTGALLCAAGLAGISFALIEQPVLGWSDPLVSGPLVAGALLFAAFIAYERRTPAPMLPLELFAHRNFTRGERGDVPDVRRDGRAGLLPDPVPAAGRRVQRARGGLCRACSRPAVMFLFSRRFGALADRHGPRWFMTFGPLLVAAGFFALLRLDADTSYLTDLVPALLLYSFGLADDRRAAHRDRARRRRRARRRHRLGGQQRGRAHRRAARDGGGRGSARRLLRRPARQRARWAPADAPRAGAGRRGARARAQPGRPGRIAGSPIGRRSPRRWRTPAWRPSTWRRSWAG